MSDQKTLEEVQKFAGSIMEIYTEKELKNFNCAKIWVIIRRKLYEIGERDLAEKMWNFYDDWEMFSEKHKVKNSGLGELLIQKILIIQDIQRKARNRFITGQNEIKKVKQTKFGNKNGNCFSAVLATILQCDILEMEEYEKRWQLPNEYDVEIHIQSYIDFLNSKNLRELTFDYDKKYIKSVMKTHPNIPIIYTGKSLRGDFLHCVIYKNGEMFHDPHPDNSGLDMVQTTSFLVRI